MIQVHGTVSERFAPLRTQLEKNLNQGDDLGASVAVIHHGELVCDLWGGYRDAHKSTLWERDTLVNVWSTTKTMTFLVMLMLADRGEVDLSGRVAHYWPEFAANGKDDIELRHLLAHSAGLSGWQEPLAPEELADWERCVSALARQTPWWSDRTQPGYHALTQGYLLGEVVRRVTGDTLGTFFRREVSEVLAADFHIGLGELDEARVAQVSSVDALNLSAFTPDSIGYRTLTSPALDAELPNQRWWRAAEIPAANGHGNARSVAMIQQIIANRGEANGHRFFSPGTNERIFEVQSSGHDYVLDVDMTFGMGYGLASATVPLGPRSAFWGGYGGSVIVTDQDLGLTIAYMMNQMRVGLIGDTRGMDFVTGAVLAALS
ncbi:MAG TPA: serine hydrolase domain-containing protein [Acidimicrobiales bacterium]|nr:serine hydrolase domain-containing protein [Acidimicrobiales bacterium]